MSSSIENKKELNTEFDRMINKVSHDLKAPLRAVLSYSRFLMEDYGEKLDGEGKKYIERIMNNADNMSIMIESLLKYFSTIHTNLIIEDINLTDLFNEEIIKHKIINSDRVISINIPELPQIKGDTAQISLLISNALSNAFKFTSIRPKTIINISFEENEDEYIISISDNGVGFDMKYSPKLFNLFERLHTNTEFSGVGMGLAIIKNIIKNHDGKVWITSDVDNGTTLFFSFPKTLNYSK